MILVISTPTMVALTPLSTGTWYVQKSTSVLLSYLLS